MVTKNSTPETTEPPAETAPVETVTATEFQDVQEAINARLAHLEHSQEHNRFCDEIH